MNARIGRMGEDAVCQHLLSIGHSILQRNWRSGHLEVDIISLAADGIHFVEVKTRVAPVSADPIENINLRKQQNITKAAARYLSGCDHGTENLEVWLDAATVVLDGGTTIVEYYPGAYTPFIL